jgi:uncharacterized protein
MQLTRYDNIEISSSIGSVSAIVEAADAAKNVLILAHGAGAGMEHEFMSSLSALLCKSGITVIRFNFPYMQKGQRRPDSPVIAHKTIERIIQFANARYPELNLFLSGKSFGGRMASQYISKFRSDLIKGLIFYGFPLHPTGKPSTQRAEHLENITIPMLFLQGSNDKLANLGLLEPIISHLDTAVLRVLTAADHSFNVPKKSGLNKEAVYQWLVTQSNSWIGQII